MQEVQTHVMDVTASLNHYLQENEELKRLNSELHSRAYEQERHIMDLQLAAQSSRGSQDQEAAEVI